MVRLISLPIINCMGLASCSTYLGFLKLLSLNGVSVSFNKSTRNSYTYSTHPIRVISLLASLMVVKVKGIRNFCFRHIKMLPMSFPPTIMMNEDRIY